MSNSPEEFIFKKIYEKKHPGERLVHGSISQPDWLNLRTGEQIEVKGINYPRAHFTEKIRINAMSISRHAQENPNAKIALVFTDGTVLTGEPKRIVENSQIEPSQHAGDRLTYLTPLSVFQPF